MEITSCQETNEGSVTRQKSFPNLQDLASFDHNSQQEKRATATTTNDQQETNNERQCKKTINRIKEARRGKKRKRKEPETCLQVRISAIDWILCEILSNPGHIEQGLTQLATTWFRAGLVGHWVPDSIPAWLECSRLQTNFGPDFDFQFGAQEIRLARIVIQRFPH